MKLFNQFLQASSEDDAILGFVFIIFFILFFVGIRIIITGYKNKVLWKMILGVWLTGIFFGVVILFILYVIYPPAHLQKPSKKSSTTKRKPRKTSKKSSS